MVCGGASATTYWVRFVVGVIVAASAAAAQAQPVVSLATSDADRTLTVIVDQAVVVESAASFADVSIAQPEVADVQPLTGRSLYLLGKQRGRTSLTLLGGAGELIANITVVVQPDIAELKQRLAQLLPQERIDVRPAGGGLVLSGAVSGAQAVDRAVSLARAYAGQDVTNLMSVGGAQQVSLKVRIAEINRSAAKDLGIGIGIGAQGRSGDSIAGVGTGNIDTDIAGGTAFTRGATNGFGVLDAVVSITDSLLLAVTINALETKGFARMLAEPNLVALSGGEADFLAGGEVPVPRVNEDGEVDVTFRPVGVSMAFKPTVLSDDRINIAVTSEVSSVDPTLGTTVGGLQILGFSVRRATTTVELKDGQSFAIAGIYQDNFADNVSQVPWLGDVPILGALFRSADFQRGETELVVLVTADLVGPVDDRNALSDPTERVSIPNESDLFLFGDVGGEGAPPFDGPFGYALE